MASINVFIKKDYLDKNGKAPVILEYAHLTERWRINTRIKVEVEKIECIFDKDTDLFKLTALRRLNKEDQRFLKENNATLQKLYIRFSQIITDLKSRSLPLSPKHVQAEYERETPAFSSLLNKSLMEWYDDFIAIKEKEIGNGINSYRSTREHLKSFMKGKGNLQFQDLTKVWLDGFRDYLISLELGGVTVHKQFKNLRIFINWIKGSDEHDKIRIPSTFRKYQIKARYGDPIGLTLEQFLQLQKLDLSQHKELDRTRDLFVFAVAIGGPRHGDLRRLGESLRKYGFNLNQDSITYFEHKTGNAHQELVLNNLAMSILKKYNYKFPYVPSNQRMNANLKAIGKKLEWNEIKFLPKYDAFGKLVGVDEVPLKDLFSTKFMRKTAPTIDHVLGIPTKTSMKRTGHKTFAAFSRYVDVNRESLEFANQKWDKKFKIEHHLNNQPISPGSK